MTYTSQIISIIEVVIVTIPVLLTVAFVTIAERKTMASMQRRLGPNIVGYYGLLQAFADALKLLLKEYISPTQSNLALFFLGPVITLIFSLLGFSVIPYGPGIALSDFDLGILYMLAVSSLSTYGILLAGWSANSKYAFLGSLRSTAQLISYELILSSAILLVILLSGSLSLTVNTEAQKATWFILPLLPIFIIFFIGSIAETNRAPFDLAEAESELVSGFMTEHAAVIFVFFFLAEYASIVLICILTSILFLGGYLINFLLIAQMLDNIMFYIEQAVVCIVSLGSIISTTIGLMTSYLENLGAYFSSTESNALTAIFMHSEEIARKIFERTALHSDAEWVIRKDLSPFAQMIKASLPSDLHSDLHSNWDLNMINIKCETFLSNALMEGLIYGLTLGLKSCIMIFIFIWARASFPRIRYDQLMSFCWTILLPLIIAFIILYPCILYSFAIVPTNTYLL